MEPERVLSGHTWVVRDLAAVRRDDGRVLLVSWDGNDTTRARVWDPLTGELAGGPFEGGEIRAKLGSLGIGPVEQARACRYGIVPAAAGSPALIVHHDSQRVWVTESGTDVVVCESAEPPDPPGHIGPKVFTTTGVRFTDGTAGFAAVRFSGDVEVWRPRRRRSRRWRRDVLTDASYGGRLAVLPAESGGSHLAVNLRTAIEVWDASSRQRVARVDMLALAGGPGAVPRIGEMAPVPLASGPALAVVVERRRDTGVQICDPYRGQFVGEVFNRHGPAFGEQGVTSQILALAAVPGPDGTVRVASAGQDGTVRISAPIG